MSGLALPKSAIPSPAPSSGLALPGNLARRPSQLSISTVPPPAGSPLVQGTDVKPNTAVAGPSNGAGTVVGATGVKDEDEDEEDEDGPGGKGKKRKIGAGVGLGVGGLADMSGQGAGVKEYKYSAEISQMVCFCPFVY